MSEVHFQLAKDAVAERTGISVERQMLPTTDEERYARNLAMYMLWLEGGYTHTAIGQHWNLDRTTAYRGVQRIITRYSTQRLILLDIYHLSEILKDKIPCDPLPTSTTP